MNVSTVRANLKSRGFYYDDEDALARGGQAIKDKAREIITSQRNSPTSNDNAPLLKAAIRKYCGSTERTLVFNVWCILRQQKLRDITEKPLSPQGEDNALAWVKRAWSMDFLDCVFEADLNKDMIPDTSHTGSKTTDIMFKDLPRIEQPRPDVTYGLWKADIDSPCRGILDTYHCELAKDVELPWFLVEVKTLNAVVGEAENQCIRGGAVLVNGHHQWNRVADGVKHSLDLSKKEKEEEHDRLIAKREKAGTAYDKLQSTADSATLAFSLAFSPSTATMHVHWREEWENGVEHWHAHTIQTYAMRTEHRDYEQLGMHMANIMDWGCRTRRMEIEKQAKVIAKRKYPGIDENEVCFAPNKRQKSG
ncbi:hypothetical protein HO133_000001 [Letharia lupina]|uniref:DUF7924 domain-containing protein n=1 Tax=Letharia lupina TaxID=560253 RepID=A0A8H6FLM1_9LECA|nr:uncharacterized protein HO133_000001 [Letharia lupina]KAF6230742.1 hypothetical protein HO133_000001 [Letharia lupina]